MIRDDVKESVLDYISEKKVIYLLRDLVEIRSPFFHEEEIVNYVKRRCNEIGLETELYPVKEEEVVDFEGNNIVARYNGDSKGPKLLLNGHLDTINLCEGWSKPPYKGYVNDGKLYGVGSLDMKGGIAAILLALEALINNDVDLKGELVFTGVIDEEGPYGLGSYQLIKDGFIDDFDYSIIPEPSGGLSNKSDYPIVILGSKGSYKYEINVKGKPAHGSEPEEGINAIEDASKIVNSLNNLDLASHPKLGEGKLCVIGIDGGGEPLSVPDKCKIEVFRHVVPGEDRDTVLNQMRKLVDSLNLRSQVEVKLRDRPDSEWGFKPYVIDEDEEIVKSVQKSWKELNDEEATIDYYNTVGDFNLLSSIGEIPTIITGPDGENYHSADEYVKLSSVVETSKVLTLTVLDLLG